MRIEMFDQEHRFLSNFYPTEVCFDGLVFPSSEAAYQAAKTLDLNERLRFTTMRPGAAKRAGRKLKIRSDWDEVKVSVMEIIVREKFKNPKLRRLLLLTGDALLVEGNHWHDTFWGVCNGVGKNHLGRILMWVREEIKQGVQPL